MAFDPTLPGDADPVIAPPLRQNFNGLKALIDAAALLVPIGAVLPWFKDLPGVPALPAAFAECNGQTLNDPESPLHGQALPALNTEQRFLRGGAASGQTGGIDSFGTTVADNSGIGTPQAVVTPDASPGAMPFPPYLSAVFVMRVK